jgi:hypothetical protein
MRKGLVVTLGVVALFLVASQSFSIAPVISSIPDIIVSDAEQNTATEDRNFFIFSNALDLDELVRDDDTTRSALKWFFIQSSGPAMSLNGITEYTGTNYTNPGASDIRAVSRLLTVRNIDWSPPTSSIPFPNPGVASADSMIQMVVTDQTKVDSAPVTITSVNTPNNASTQPRDRLVPQSIKTYTFASGPEGWEFIPGNDPGSSLYPASSSTPAGSLGVTKSATQQIVVYGAWEMPKNPTVADAIHPRWGTVVRARYQVRSTVTSADTNDCPGFRMRCIWAHVMLSGTAWVYDAMNPDTNDDLEVDYFTTWLPAANTGVPGRAPGTTAKTYTLLYYPQQIETLTSTDAIAYFTFDLLDADFSQTDAGTLYVDQVDIDVFDRPDASVGTVVPALTASNFTAWVQNVGNISPAPTGPPFGPPNTTGMTVTRGASSLAITVTGTNKWGDATAVSDTAAKLTPGNYYRTRFILTSSQASGQSGPVLRSALISSRGVWAANKNLFGGGTWSQIRTEPTEFELWYEAPRSTDAAYSSQTEDMKVRAQSYITFNPSIPANKTVAGTLTITSVVTQMMSIP